MKLYGFPWLVILLLILGTLHADDFTTLDGEKYTNATIKRVDPDGLVISHEDGITKLKFKNLSADLQTKYGYDSQKEAAFKNQLKASAIARQTEAIVQVQEAKTKAASEAMAQEQDALNKQLQGNTYSIKIVETDQRNYIGKVFYIKGSIEMSSFYSSGYRDAQNTHNVFKIHDGDVRKNTWGSANAYMVREKSDQIRNKIINAGGTLDGIFKVVLLPDRFEEFPFLELELLDFYPSVQR